MAGPVRQPLVRNQNRCWFYKEKRCRMMRNGKIFILLKICEIFSFGPVLRFLEFSGSFEKHFSTLRTGLQLMIFFTPSLITGGISFNTAGSLSTAVLWKVSLGKLQFPRTLNNIEFF